MKPREILTKLPEKMPGIISRHHFSNLYFRQISYNFPHAEVTDDNGVPGQSNANPASLFNNHQVVVSGECYDPSYGIKRASLADIDRDAIAGFYKLARIPLNEADYNLDLNQDGDEEDTEILTYVFIVSKETSGEQFKRAISRSITL
jgi:hypothetical protein